ncbi:MAG: hypothetical protein JRI25_13095 [Deltaproteobacteria bacterium]|nr:hypothetical protein [Deltaproteobacteria bacterium]
MESCSLHLRTLHRLDGSVRGDDDLGDTLARMVRKAVDGRAAPPIAVCIRTDRLDLLDLGEAVRGRFPPALLLAALTRAEVPCAGPVEAVGVLGRFRYRPDRDHPGIPVATVFVEWPDCRWWHWQALVDPANGWLLPETETVLRAVDGGRRPSSLGGWWSTGRRARLRARLEPSEPVTIH